MKPRKERTLYRSNKRSDGRCITEAKGAAPGLSKNECPVKNCLFFSHFFRKMMKSKTGLTSSFGLYRVGPPCVSQLVKELSFLKSNFSQDDGYQALYG